MQFIGEYAGAWSPALASAGTTTLTFTTPPSGAVLVLAHATVRAGVPGPEAIVGVRFGVYESGLGPRASRVSQVAVTPPAHGTPPVACFAVTGLTPDSTLQVTIEAEPGSELGVTDFYSIGLAEIET